MNIGLIAGIAAGIVVLTLVLAYAVCKYQGGRVSRLETAYAIGRRLIWLRTAHAVCKYHGGKLSRLKAAYAMGRSRLGAAYVICKYQSWRHSRMERLTLWTEVLVGWKLAT